jgi:hypothetical protein
VGSALTLPPTPCRPKSTNTYVHSPQRRPRTREGNLHHSI